MEKAQVEEGDRYYPHDDLNAVTVNGGKKQERLLGHRPLRLLLQHHQHQDDVDEAKKDDEDDTANQASAEKGDDKKSDEECPKLSMRTRSKIKDEIGVPYQHQEQQQQDDEQHDKQEEEINSRRIRPPRSIVIPSLANDSLTINEEESFDILRSPFFDQRQAEEDLTITDESTRIVPDRGKTKVVIHHTTPENAQTNIKAEVNADDHTSQDYILMDECSKYVSKVKMELLALDREEHFERFLQVLGHWEEDDLSYGEVLFEMRLILQDTSEEDLLDEFISFLPSDAHEAARLEIAAARLVKEEKIFQKERAN